MTRRRAERERLLDAASAHPDATTAPTPVSRLLDAARGPASAGELAGLDAAMSAFASAQGATSGDDAARASHRRPVLVGALAAAGVGTKMFLTAAAVGAIGVAGVVAVELNGSSGGPVPAGTSTAATVAPTANTASGSADVRSTAPSTAGSADDTTGGSTGDPRESEADTSGRPTASATGTNRTHPTHPTHPSHPAHPSGSSGHGHSSATKSASHPPHPSKKPHPTRPSKLKSTSGKASKAASRSANRSSTPGRPTHG